MKRGEFPCEIVRKSRLKEKRMGVPSGQSAILVTVSSDKKKITWTTVEGPVGEVGEGGGGG